jgi:hypothetical protein
VHLSGGFRRGAATSPSCLDGRAIGDSTHIIAALEERYPEPPIYPGDAGARRTRSHWKTISTSYSARPCGQPPSRRCSGTKDPPRRPQPLIRLVGRDRLRVSRRGSCGYVTVTANRRWLLFVDSKRPAPKSAALTDPEAVAAMRTNVAWTGQYTIGEQSQDGLKATARVDTASSPALPGTDRVYFMKVEGNKLSMKSPGADQVATTTFR